MFSNVVIGVKEGIENRPLLALAKKAAPSPANLHLVSAIRVGTNEDEVRRLKDMERALGDMAEELREEGYQVTVDVSLMVVAAAAVLVKAATNRRADLIVIGMAKRTRVGKALLGSDAQRILLAAECPVLVMHLYGE